MATPNRVLKCLVSIVALAPPGVRNAYAGPVIPYTYYNTWNNYCEDYCAKEIWGNCIQWGTYCNKRINGAWEDGHMVAIDEALEVLSARIDNPAVRQCIVSNTKWFMGSYAPKAKLEEQAWLDFDALAEVNEWPEINILAYRTTEPAAGSAKLERNAWGSADFLHWSGNLEISLNLNSIERTWSNAGFDGVVNWFAGTVLHEVLHQMGHNHPVGVYNKGHFIAVAGFCLTSDGEKAIPLVGEAFDMPK